MDKTGAFRNQPTAAPTHPFPRRRKMSTVRRGWRWLDPDDVARRYCSAIRSIFALNSHDRPSALLYSTVAIASSAAFRSGESGMAASSAAASSPRRSVMTSPGSIPITRNRSRIRSHQLMQVRGDCPPRTRASATRCRAGQFSLGDVPRYRDTRSMDHVSLYSTRRKPARQPEAVAAGFEGKRNPLIVRPALTASSCQRCSRPSTCAASASAFASKPLLVRALPEGVAG
jgi:hypothetical protein